jgi:hypothetical protein
MGNSGGGGGGAGEVSYPTYVEDYFSDMTIGLGAGGGTTMTMDIVTAMNTAQAGATPFATAVAYDPDTDIAAYEAAITAFDAILAAIDEPTDWATLYDQAETSIVIPDEAVDAITDAEIVIDSAAFGASLDDQITSVILPRFRRGMQNINAVVSSAFVVGAAVIEGFRTRDVAKHESGLRVAAQLKNADVEVKVAIANLSKDVGVSQTRVSATSDILRFLMQKYAWEEAYARLVIEANRIKIVAKKEESEVNLEIDEADASWDLEVFQHGANMLASIGGGTSSPQKRKKNQMASAIGGALTGAAGGAMVGASYGTAGGPYGAVIGAVLGAAAGLLL